MVLFDKGEETSITYTEPTVDTYTWNISSRLTQDDLVWYMNQCFEDSNVFVKWIPEADGYYIHADHVFSLNDNLGMIIPISGSLSHTWRIPFDDGVYYANYGPMVAEYPVDITNGLSNIQLYCNIVKSKTIPLLANVPMGQFVQELFLQESHVGTMFRVAGPNRIRVERRKQRVTLVHREHLPVDRIHSYSQ